MSGPRSPRLGCALAVAIALAVAACGGRAARPGAPAEVLVEVLPRRAEVTLDGRPIPAGGGVVPAPGRGQHVLAARADGYEPLERALPEDDLVGARVAAALVPGGFRAARALDYDDPEGLALAAAFLVRAGAAADAVEYAERAAALDPRLPPAHLALGDARAALGDSARAVEAWQQYLRLAPEAPDADAVARRIDASRGDARP